MQDAADYSTELRAVKHPYTRGIAARAGVNTDTYKGPRRSLTMRAAGLSRPKENYRSKQRMAFLSGLLHPGRQPAGGKDQRHGCGGQNGGADVPGHVGAGGVIERRADLGTDKRADAVADEDQP